MYLLRVKRRKLKRKRLQCKSNYSVAT